MSMPPLIAGVDEAGRGPLAGPVCAAAVILDPARDISGLDDSKKLSATRRAELSVTIRESVFAWSIGWASVEEIDSLNILQANFLAMRRAVEALGHLPSLALVDGRDDPGLCCPVRPIIGGDALEPAISAASILAKTARDEAMCLLDSEYPMYGFAAHKGYGVKRHIEALQTHGPCPHHRHSFAPVREAAARFA